MKIAEICTQMGPEAMEGLHFLAYLPLAGKGQREGGGFCYINKRIISHPVISWEHEEVVLNACLEQCGHCV